MAINKLKKYSGLSMIMGGVMLLSGCDVVGTCDYHASQKHIYLSSAPASDNSISNINVTTAVSTSPVVTTTSSVVSSESEDDSYAYAGYGYKEEEKAQSDLSKYVDILYSSCAKDMCCRYVYYKHEEFYSITDDDSLADLCDQLNMTIDDLYSHNPSIQNYVPGTVISYPVMEELYVGIKGDDIDSISLDTGVDVEYIMRNNVLNLSDHILNDDSYILLHKFIGNETSYRTNKGIVNIVNNNRIFGNNIIQASGFAGASRYVLALNESVYSYGVNEVTCYTFDEYNNYTSEIICFNARDIINVDGMPIAILRNDDDVRALAESVSVDVDDMAYMQWESRVSDGYSVSNSGDTDYIIMSGIEMDNLDLGKALVKTK